MTLYNEALSYYERGWNTLPLKPKTKMPLVKWAYLQEQRATKEDLKRWFQDTENNIGIVTGKISNLTVVDCDNQDAIERYYLKAEPSGRSVATPNGLHFYHRFAEGRNSQDKGLDVRNEGGYIVAPPSENMRGERYEWDSTEAMTKFNPQWFQPTRVQLKSIMNTGLNYDVAVASCVNYVSKIEGAVSGQNGHSKTFRVACKIIDFCGSFMSVDEMMPIMREYNERCEPEWSESELRYKLESAYRIKRP